ncbi:AGAP012587-PA-like protein [Anopheles sinensis]|uniref:AGAP012587-PA-like protein n=1 Tax=Anopheles sinensis TaxID=74873 RepID=A0A084WHF8_ANOSI|nr:AGAP012587-PA-like protein [Anopheles sinensis]
MTEASSPLRLRPLTKENILFYYFPLKGMLSYAALSVNVMNPSIAIKLLPKRDVTNFLLIHTIFGTTLYMYSRPHLKALPSNKRFAYSICGSVLFSFGSVLVWAVLRSAIPRNQGLSTALGLSSGLLIAKLSYDYLENNDSQAVVKKN